jgi:hypothetical protein
MSPDYVSFVVILVGWAASLLTLSWSLGKKYGELQAKIEKNSQDINAFATVIRRQIRVQDYLLQSQVKHIQDHLSKRDDYNPPTLNTFED